MVTGGSWAKSQEDSPSPGLTPDGLRCSSTLASPSSSDKHIWGGPLQLGSPTLWNGGAQLCSGKLRRSWRGIPLAPNRQSPSPTPQLFCTVKKAACTSPRRDCTEVERRAARLGLQSAASRKSSGLTWPYDTSRGQQRPGYDKVPVSQAASGLGWNAGSTVLHQGFWVLMNLKCWVQDASVCILGQG